jgi:transposase-like protein
VAPPPVNGTDPPRRPRLSPEERAERNRAIGRAHLAGRSWREICAEHGVSRNTARQAARDYAEALRREGEPEELTALRNVDLEALVALGVEAHGEALRGCLRLIRPSKNEGSVIGAGNAVSRLLSSLTQNFVRLGLLPDPADEALRRRAERFEAVWGRALGKAYAGLPEEDFERLLAEVAADARIQGGLALATYTTNGGGRDEHR